MHPHYTAKYQIQMHPPNPALARLAPVSSGSDISGERRGLAWAWRLFSLALLSLFRAGPASHDAIPQISTLRYKGILWETGKNSHARAPQRAPALPVTKWSVQLQISLQ